MPALELSRVHWRKSSHSSDMANCIEVVAAAGTVAVRDSKNPAGSVLAIPLPAWTVFTAAVRTGELG
ncbi:MAG: DUF397 domain-containing protein [Pseudonocardia sp.]|nr:DUF397 domain-containing protein [Pseudonocardia sp.]